MAELLVEIRSQELPAEQVPKLLRRLGVRVFEDLMSLGIPMEELRTGGTPRRLAIAVTGLPERDRDREVTELGPAVVDAFDADGEPTAELLAFAERFDRAPENLERQRTERGERVAAKRVEPGRPIAEVLGDRLERLLHDLLRPSDATVGAARWPRPVTGVVALVDGEPLDLVFEGHRAGRESVGHPVFSPEPFEVGGFDDYVASLEERGIVLAVEARARALVEALDRAAETLGGRRVEVDGLVARLAASCEVPGVVHGRIEGEFLDLPHELLRVALAERQDAFCVVEGAREGADGEPGGAKRKKSRHKKRERKAPAALLPAFLAVADRPDDPEGRVRRGRERAVAGVLADLRFFVEADRRVPLAQRVRRLDQVTFHPGLGTFADRGQRVGRLVALICETLGWSAALDDALEAATLCEADRTTAVVAAYPSLRGTVGGLYARQEGYVDGVWRAIRDHLRPGSAGTRDVPIPEGAAGRALAVANRLDTLVGVIGLDAGSAPGDPDPRALASGLLRIVIEGKMSLDLDLLAARAVLLYGDRIERGSEELLRDLQGLLDERLDHLLGGRGFAPDEIEAAKAVGTRDLPALVARVEALRAVRHEPAFHRLVEGAKRVSKIVEGAEEAPLDRDLLVEDAERALAEIVDAVGEKVEVDTRKGHWVDALHHLEALGGPLERFFSDVLVRPEDERLRTNRLALLQACRRLYWRVARLKALRLDPSAGPTDAGSA